MSRSPALRLQLPHDDRRRRIGRICVSVATRDMWERLFDEGYEADVLINTDNSGTIYAHSYILVSPFIPITKIIFHLIYWIQFPTH